ncbi:MAG: hypothetical protein Q7J68_06300, partial [Thermoplasmata archaeon]|nr:hypothetical protein [Thermoplasmata archaeon]
QQHLQEASPDDKRIYKHKKSILLRYIRTLFFLPVFDMERPIDLDSYEGNTLGIFTSPSGNQVKYRTTDRFLRELTSLKIGNEMSRSLLRCYYNTFYGNTEMPVYIDGHFKAVWTLKNIPKGKHGMMDRVMPGIEQVVLNSKDGHPLLHRTCPGDRHLTKELLPIVEEFENTIGREVANMVIVDAECCSLDQFKEFDKINKDRKMNTYLLTMMDSNQYHFEDLKIRDNNVLRPVKDSDFIPYKNDKKGRVRSWVTLVEFDYLSNVNRKRKNKTTYMVRCSVVKKKNNSLSVIATNQPYDEISSGKELADMYYNRWPCQEAKFKEMKKYCNLNVNHGFKKKKVFNRMADKRFKRTEKSLAYDKRRLENQMEKHACVKRQMEKRNDRFKIDLKKLESQKEKINERLKYHKGDENKQRKRWEKKVKEAGQLEGLHQENIRVLEEKERTLSKRKKLILKSIEQNKTEVTRWKTELEDTPFYEIDTEMDHIMANFKILLENSLLYTKDTFFEGKVGMGQLTKQFINHYGDLHILDGGKIFRFQLNKFDGKGLTKKMRYACKIFNEMKIRTADGILLEMVVKR